MGVLIDHCTLNVIFAAKSFAELNMQYTTIIPAVMFVDVGENRDILENLSLSFVSRRSVQTTVVHSVTVTLSVSEVPTALFLSPE